jgi:drug/metabolite transporter (DMT)-like permease
MVSISWQGAVALAGAGVIHFILGRITAYSGIGLIGANRAVPIFSSSILIAALWGILLLGEPVTPFLVLAILLIVGGIVLISTTGSSAGEKSSLPAGSLIKGILLTLTAALCWGSTPLLVKIGLREVGSPLLATFVSYLASSVVIGLALFYPANNEKLRRLNRYSLMPILGAAVAVAAAQILRYEALVISPVSLFEPLMASANSLFIFPLSFLINRQIEVFNWRIIIGAVAILTGVFLIFWVA